MDKWIQEVLIKPRYLFFYSLLFSVLVLRLIRPLVFGDDNLFASDYHYFFPYLLSGYYWFLNNGLAAPWFTPALCAGIPHFANPQSAYYSIPQFLLLFSDPGTSVIFTFYIAGVAGFAGAWLLAGRLTQSPLVMLFAACAFMLNSFILARFQVGHLTFHAYMLLPGICHLLLSNTTRTGQSIGTVIVTGMLLTYIVQSGAGVIIVPFGIALVLLLVIFSAEKPAWIRLVLAGVFGIALSASKLVALSYYLNEFPRDFYLLPGYETILTSLVATIRSLSWTIQATDANTMIVNRSFLIGFEELDYRVTVPFMISLGSVFIYRQFHLSWKRLLFIILLLSLPILLNTYQENWSTFLKTLPYFGTATSLFRWNLIYILPIILLSVRVLDYLINRTGIAGNLFAITGIVGVLGMPFFSLDSHVPRAYDSSTIEKAYWEARSTGDTPAIFRVEESLVNGKRLSTLGSGDALVRGASQLVCNEPMFGYRLETFRFDQVYRGGVFAVHGGLFNFYKPECMIYPAENSCRPGDRFPPDENENLARFVTWQPYDYAVPVAQSIANVVNGIALALLLLYFLSRIFDLMRKMKLY